MPPPNPNFPPPNFSMPPPGFVNGMPPAVMGGGITVPPPGQSTTPIDPTTQDIWVETTSPEGKVSHSSCLSY